MFCSRCWVQSTDSRAVTKCPREKPVYDPNVDGLGYFSPSQIEAYRTCPRKWAWKYIERIEAPPNPYAAFGLAVHFQIERYLIEGVPFDLTTDAGECAMAGIHLIPRPGTPGMSVEQPWFMSGWGHLFHGKKDIQIDRVVGTNILSPDNTLNESALVDPLHGQRVPIIIDHKTTGDLNAGWNLTPDTLPKNPQAVLYAADAMLKLGTQAVDLRWNYYRRRRPFKAKPVDVRVYRETLEPALADIKNTADEMALIKLSGTRAKDLPPNPDACGAYGGCPFVRHCDLSPHEALIGIMTQMDKNAFVEEMRRKANIGNPQAVNPPPVGAIPMGQPAPQPQNGQPPQNWGPPQGQFAPQGQPANPPWTGPGSPVANATLAPQVPSPPAPPNGPPQFSPDGTQVWIPGSAGPIPMPQDNVVRSADGAYFWAPTGQSWVLMSSLPGPVNPVLNPATGAAPMPQTTDGASAENGDQNGGEGEAKKNKGGRPQGSKNKIKAPDVNLDPNANPVTLALEGLDMIITGMIIAKQALIRITGHNPQG